MSPRRRAAGKTFNGVQLGLGSPILELPKRRKYFGPDEFAVQRRLIDLLLGVLSLDGPYKGRRVPGAGYSGKYPELSLLYAVPNGGHRLKVAAGKAKAEGVLVSMCDLVLPAPRYPWHGLYLEVKTEGGELRADQKATMLELLARGYAAIEGRGLQECLDGTLGYLALPRWPEPPELLELRRRSLAKLTTHPLPTRSHG